MRVKFEGVVFDRQGRLGSPPTSVGVERNTKIAVIPTKSQKDNYTLECPGGNKIKLSTIIIKVLVEFVQGTLEEKKTGLRP